MGGGEGMIDKEVIEWMKSREYPQNVRFMIVCGRNTKLYQSLQEDFSDHSQITVMGYVDRMHELMAMADLMVTKPGGLTISEALTMERPMLLVKPLRVKSRIMRIIWWESAWLSKPWLVN